MEWTTWRTQTAAMVGFRPTRGSIIEIILKVICKSLSNAPDNVRFNPSIPRHFLRISSHIIFIRSPFLFSGNN
ncbi:hypothetical protein [Burkholderia paludis]|uniref:hypothetical protein n=1 Tax=Burkholderia paludis TaxID=1506587 RepID=UPI0012699D57|nr:hypothetical protein [Burkholderia paludis]